MNQFDYLLCLTAVEIFADFALKHYVTTGSQIAISIGAFGYAVIVFLLVKSLQGSTLLYVKGMWDGLSGLAESLAAFVFLGERFVRWEQYLGLGLTFVGLFLLKSRPEDSQPNVRNAIYKRIATLDVFTHPSL